MRMYALYDCTNEDTKISNACGTMGLLHALLNVRALCIQIHWQETKHNSSDQSCNHAWQPFGTVHRTSEMFVWCTLHSQSLPSAHQSLTAALDPHERSKLLETTPLFASIHAQAASTGQTAVPTNLDTDYHFTCFIQAEVEKDGVTSKRLVELDGRRVGPVDRGPSEDLMEVCGQRMSSVIQES
jgi:hypothetical protein